MGSESKGATLWSRRVFALCLLVPFSAVLTGGNCHYHTCHDDDDFDDDDCHHHDDDDAGTNSASAGLATENYSLEVFRRELADTPGAHPVRRLFEIEGVSLFAGRGSVAFGERELRDFTAKVYDTNRALIGFPEDIGTLVFVEARFEETHIEVDWVQVFEEERGPEQPAGRMTFVLDSVGRLTEIRNHTWIE